MISPIRKWQSVADAHDAVEPCRCLPRPQCMGRFRMAKSINTDQHEHMPRAVRQCGDGALHVKGRCIAGGIRPVGQARDGLRHLIFDPQAVASRQHAINGNVVQPGGKAAAPLEAGQGSPGSDEGILRTILGRLSLAGEPQAQTIDSR